VVIFVRYQQLTDELQMERDALRATVVSSEAQLLQQSSEIQQLHNQVTA